MANTRDDVTITKGVWVDLYAGSGISVGTACVVINKGNSPFYVAISSTAPATPTTGSPKGFPVYPSGLFNSIFSVPASASGAWAFCPGSQNSIALVQE